MRLARCVLPPPVTVKNSRCIGQSTTAGRRHHSPGLPKRPRLSNLGTTLAIVGAFGHSVFGGVSMVLLSMAADSANREVRAELLQAVESGPTAVFMIMGLIGTDLGILLLSIGL